MAIAGEAPIKLSDNDVSRLTDLLSKTHIYTTNKGYVHFHIYVSEVSQADFISRKLKATVQPHLKIIWCRVSKRSLLRDICITYLMKLPLNDEQKQKFALALNYATAKTKAERLGFARHLRGRPF